MDICHITSVHQRYDTRIFYKECCTLANSGFQVSLIVADGLGDEILSSVHIYDIGKLNGRILRVLKAPNIFFKKILEMNPSVIHFHDPELITLGRKLSKLGYKVIYDVHEDVPKQVMNKRWIPKFIRPVVSMLVTIQESISCRSFVCVICATNIIAKRFMAYNSNIVAIHNYPILSELKQVNTSWDNRNNSLCYLGSISEVRGILPLVKSLAISKLPLELAGSYSDGQIKSQISNQQGSSFVHYNGILNREEVFKLLTKVKVGVVTLLPTPSYVESLPIKLLEYMLAGIPVITSNFTLWKQYVIANNCGLMVDPTNEYQIARACLYLFENQDIAQKMGENGRKTVLENFIWEVEQIKLVELYQQLLG